MKSFLKDNIIISALNFLVDRASQLKIAIIYFYSMTAYFSLVILIFSIVGFKEVDGFGQASTEWKLGYTPVGALTEIANLLFFLSISCVIYDRNKK